MDVLVKERPMDYKKFSIPINYVASSPENTTIHETVKRYSRLAKYELLSPMKFFFYCIDGDSMEAFCRARDKWKQGFVNFATADEYRLFHKKMV